MTADNDPNSDEPVELTSALNAPGPVRLSLAVYDRIIDLIAEGQFGLNQRLPSEARLGELCGASRPVVREALARLREDGVIVSRKGSGSYVQRQPAATLLEPTTMGSIADVQRCFEFRTGIEAAAANLAAGRWETEDMRRIDKAMAAIDACIARGDLGADQDSLLHEAIAEATHNQYHAGLQRQLRQHIRIGMKISRTLTLHRSRDRLQQVQSEHQAIVEAIRARDADAAGTLMREHILAARRRMFEGVDR
ncbi:FadR/GntR family transcriptional regulator [Frigidibacter sp. ROC022]|uniref:FadR/GntR family transcriptional regulator n=1 Tax=Frigidibacter sp. ROC022 TaxID=2971796 RepID=UPI00215AC0EF|nr:FCD domain-containing protein [Frigidibacter sp. ROC022]MCR8723511.1 FCD domain-containing protein [Frigidibacter sp. ROC022]